MVRQLVDRLEAAGQSLELLKWHAEPCARPECDRDDESLISGMAIDGLLDLDLVDIGRAHDAQALSDADPTDAEVLRLHGRRK